jgi:hypothetical protein
MQDASPLTQYTSIGRIFNPRLYRTHAVIFIMTVVGGVIAGAITLLINSRPLTDAIGAGFFTGAAIFMSWIISREVDPDNEYSGFLSALIAFFLVSFGTVNLLFVSLLILAPRMVNRVTGLPTRIADNILILALAIIAVVMGMWQAGIIAGVAFALDALLNQPQRSQFAFAGISIGATVVFMVTQPVLLVMPSMLVLALSLITLGVFAYVIYQTDKLKTLCDIPRYRLDVNRVRGAMFVVMLGAALTLLGGDSIVLANVPLWATLAGVAVYRFTLARMIA